MKNEPLSVTCKLTTPELQERKRSVIADLKKLVLDKVETENGARYKFESTDRNLDLLTSFIKTERLCCGFFTFDLRVGDEKENSAWLQLSGPEGTKQFIRDELGI